MDFKFSSGDVIEHKSSGQKAVVVFCEEWLDGATWTPNNTRAIYKATGKYLLCFGIEQNKFMPKEEVEIIFKKI